MIKICILLIVSISFANSATCSWMSKDLAKKMTKANKAIVKDFKDFNKEVIDLQNEYSKIYLKQYESTLNATKIRLLKIKSVAIKSKIRDNLKAITSLERREK